MTSAAVYAAMVDAYHSWTARTEASSGDRWGGQTAERFRMDPRRPLSPDLEVIASYLAPSDVLVDVGGGSGRLGLPLALRCKEVINAEPSPGMQTAFKEVAAAAGITNLRQVQASWLEAEGVAGDLCLTAHVTYFIREIEEFLRRLHRAASTRVIICINSLANPNATSPFHQLLYGEPSPQVPGHRELLPVLWDLGILPDVRVLQTRAPVTAEATPEQAVERRATAEWVRPEDRERARSLFTSHFDDLFVTTPDGVLARGSAEAKGILITWEPGHYPNV